MGKVFVLASFAVHIDVHGRIVERLAELDIAEGGDFLKLRFDFFGELAAGGKVWTTDGDFDGSRSAEANLPRICFACLRYSTF